MTELIDELESLIGWIQNHRMITLCIVGFVIILFIYLSVFFRRSTARRIHRLAKNKTAMTPEEFAEFRLEKDSKGLTMSAAHNFPGVYLLYNETKSIYYVGQGERVLDRVNMHFTGKGNGDVYADYKFGDRFSIRIIGLKSSGFDTLNELERYAIEEYRACETGYNRQRGNKG